MKIWSDSFKDHAVIPGEFAFCVMDDSSHVALSNNRNPHLSVQGNFSGAEVRAALAGNILAEASITGVYSLNPVLARSLQAP